MYLSRFGWSADDIVAATNIIDTIIQNFYEKKNAKKRHLECRDYLEYYLIPTLRRIERHIRKFENNPTDPRWRPWSKCLEVLKTAYDNFCTRIDFRWCHSGKIKELKSDMKEGMNDIDRLFILETGYVQEHPINQEIVHNSSAVKMLNRRGQRWKNSPK